MLAATWRPQGVRVVLLSLATLAGAADRASAAIVQTYEVGQGGTTSSIQVDFGNGNGYLFTVRFDGSLTGLGALQLMAAEVPGFTLELESFPWGELVAGMGVGTDYDFGTGDLWPVENYWHYWVQNDAWEWVWSPEGAGDRQLSQGSFDAWVFGSAAAPQPIPAAPTFAAIAAAALTRRRRRP
jgi:hypothetical protein